MYNSIIDIFAYARPTVHAFRTVRLIYSVNDIKTDSTQKYFLDIRSHAMGHD